LKYPINTKKQRIPQFEKDSVISFLKDYNHVLSGSMTDIHRQICTDEELYHYYLLSLPLLLIGYSDQLLKHVSKSKRQENNKAAFKKNSLLSKALAENSSLINHLNLLSLPLVAITEILTCIFGDCASYEPISKRTFLSLRKEARVKPIPDSYFSNWICKVSFYNYLLSLVLIWFSVLS
jgi:hypothetical protein